MVIVLAHLYLRLWCARWRLVGAQITYSTQQHRTEQKIQILIFDSIVIFMVSYHSNDGIVYCTGTRLIQQGRATMQVNTAMNEYLIAFGVNTIR
jgi:hypothetical protein